MEQAGLSCDTSEDPARLTDSGTFLIVEGTGRFAGASGTGNVVTGFDRGQAKIHIDGNIVVDKDAKSDEEEEK